MCIRDSCCIVRRNAFKTESVSQGLMPARTTALFRALYVRKEFQGNRSSVFYPFPGKSFASFLLHKIFLISVSLHNG